MRNVVTRAIPGAIAVVLSIIVAIAIGVAESASQLEFQTMCVIASSAIGMNVVARQSQPFTAVRTVLFVVCIVGLLLSCIMFGSFLMLVDLPMHLLASTVVSTGLIMVAFNLAYSYVIKRQKAYLDALEAEQALRRVL